MMINGNFNFLFRLQRVCLILGLLVTAACAEKKINLEDIERDNLRAEGNAKAENIQTDETKYSVNKPSVNQQQYSHETYQIPSQYNTLGGLPETFLPPQQLQDVKYSVRYISIKSNRAFRMKRYESSSSFCATRLILIKKYYLCIKRFI